LTLGRLTAKGEATKGWLIPSSITARTMRTRRSSLYGFVMKAASHGISLYAIRSTPEGSVRNGGNFFDAHVVAILLTSDPES